VTRRLNRFEAGSVGAAALLSVLAGGLDLAAAPNTAVFLAAALALVALAWIVGVATEQLGESSGPKVGGVLNATFGNAAELIITIFAIRAGQLEVATASITGSILGNTLLVLGASFVVGGVRHGTQTFDRRVAGIVSGAGDYQPALVLDRQATGGNRQPIALIGMTGVTTGPHVHWEVKKAERIVDPLSL